jgi:isopenicillin N synthase-like dioxygenase
MSVLQSIALILNKPEDFFDSWVAKGNSVLRLIHYPPVTDKTNLLRARAHADINLITLLVGAEESGLEVQHKDGSWIPIDAASKSIVCNIGDMMQLVTRGQLKSTVHRVVDYNVGDPKPRYSIPFFLHPSPDVILRSIVDDSKDSVSAHDFLEERIREIKLY